ncbi:MAG: hypothetical protein C5B44_03980 [Acidobacteria bacterium]|nr:MAG: hypothetical protein C5B44_03980 [Acidobacteriota bacterium]
MEKEFDPWNEQKKLLHNTDGSALFHEREVWWCALGVNIGFEQDGGNKNFQRPVVILKKFNLDVCLVVPLTARAKKGKYYISLGKIAGRDATAILSQIRFVDRKRLANKICTLDEDLFSMLADSILKSIFMR